MKFKDLSIRKKLAVGFLGISLSVLAMSILALIFIHQVSHNTVLMYNHPLTVSIAVRDINVNINAMHRSMKDVALAGNNEQIDSAITLVDSCNSEVLEAFYVVFNRFLGKKEDVDRAYRSFLDWKEIRDEVIRLKYMGNHEAAAEITRGRGAKHVEQMLNQTKIMTDYAEMMASRFYHNAQKMQRRSTILIIIIFSILLIFTFFFAYYFSFIITRPIKHFITEVKDIFEVQSDLHAGIHQLNENQLFFTITKELKSSYQRIKESNKQLKSFNKELESRIAERTKELQKNEQTLKRSNEEYQALNEEYLAQNEEMVEALERIQKINEDLTVEKNKAEESDKLKSSFLANMSHEIRTPMNGIIGFSEMYADPNINEEKRQHYANLVIESSHRLLAILNDILDISRIETGQIKINPELVVVNDIITSIYEFYKPKSLNSNIHFSAVKSLNNQESAIITDHTKLYQILNNLVNNAFKFTFEGEIKMGYEKDGEQLIFFVKDTGIGIKSENHDKVFERFRQEEIEFDSQFGGIGLGLAISKNLVKLLGGRIWLQSEEGKGADFFFTIPYKNVTHFDEKKSIGSVDLVNVSNETKVLIAEDEDINYMYLEEIMIEANIEVIRARNGEEAVEMVKKHPDVRLILMDIKMPKMNGYDAAKMIKNLHPEIPIIAQTAYAMVEDREKSLKAQCDDYISKPIEKNELIRLMNKFLRK